MVAALARAAARPPVVSSSTPSNRKLSEGQVRRLRETLIGTELAPSGRANTNGNAGAPNGHASSAAIQRP
jgi:hypothetical protein